MILGQRDIEGRASEVAVVLGELVAENQVVAPDGWGELGDQAMVLMCVGGAGHQDQVECLLRRGLLEGSLDDVPVRRKPSIRKS